MHETTVPHAHYRVGRVTGDVLSGLPPASDVIGRQHRDALVTRGRKFIYLDGPRTATQMFDSLYRAGAFATYQLTLVLGIALMPLALLARQLGVSVPLGSLVAATGRAYDRTSR
jgi:hypothetical protein